MKPLLIFCCLLFSLMPAAAQDYQCFQPGLRVYFINDFGYLHGMRIDSVRAAGTETVYYPYRTARGRWNPPAPLDTNGASWLGKKVIRQPDGTTLFDNIRQDTIVLKTGAGVGAQWIFYNDTSSVHYLATVAAIDTMTISGSPDSVKCITLQAMQGTTVVTADPANQFRILISKNHGLVEVFDLYNFPYRKAGMDYYFDRTQAVSYPAGAMYRRVDFRLPVQSEVFDFQPGDVFQHTVPMWGGSPSGYATATILSRTASPGQVAYTTDHKLVYPVDLGWPQGYVYQTTQYQETRTYTDAVFPIMDTLLMPEEWPNPYLYYYHPADTSHCITGKLYGRATSHIYPVARNLFHEWCGRQVSYKAGIGIVDSSICFDPSPGPNSGHARQLTYLQKDPINCRAYTAVSVATPQPAGMGIRVFPNPAADGLRVTLPAGAGTYRAALYNPTGQQVWERQQDSRQELLIDVSALPEGLYLLELQTGDGPLFRKVAVMH